MSIPITIYEINSGQILGNGNVPDLEHAKFQLQIGQDFIEGTYSPREFRVVKSKPVEYTTEQKQRYADKPSAFHKWDASRGKWNETRNEAQIKQEQNWKVIHQISILESKQPRAMREAVLSGNKDKLVDLDSQITALRNQLHPKE